MPNVVDINGDIRVNPSTQVDVDTSVRPSVGQVNVGGVNSNRQGVSTVRGGGQAQVGNDQGIVDQIVADEVARDAAERAERLRQERLREEEKKRQELALKRRSDKIASEEIRRAAKEREAARQRDAEQASSLLSRQSALDAKLDSMTDQALSELIRDVDSSEKLRKEQAAAAEARLDERTDKVYQEFTNELAEQEGARAKDAESREARLDERTDRAYQELLDKINSDENTRIKDIERRGQRDANIADLLDEISGDEVRRASRRRAMDRASELLRDNPGMGVSDAIRLAFRLQTDQGPSEAERDDGQSTNDAFDSYVASTNRRIQEIREAQAEAQERLRKERIRRRIDRETRNDEPTEAFTDVTGIKSEDKMINRIIKESFKRQKQEYERVKNREPGIQEVSKDATSKQIADAMDENDEPKFMRALSTAQNLMMERFLNPYSLRVEGMTVETRKREKNGETRTEAKLVYSEKVKQGIGLVRLVYNCSEYNVLQLVQLRAGLGVGVDGTIANIDPNEFKLTEDQFYQLCRDIVRSQDKNGNPLGPVQGTPGGVRDDTGRFVVVAGTRCFPLGYMPRQLIEDLSASPNSELHNMTEREIQTMVNNQWLNVTYPQLVANTGGKLAYQARAIENMMRAIMAIDGMNPADLDIPEVQYNRTIMAMRIERETVSDPALVRANREKDRRKEREVSHWYHMYRKSGGSRDGGARITSASDRRRNGLGDSARGLSSMTKMAKASNVFIWLTNPVEAAEAMVDQRMGNSIYDFFLYHGRHEDEMQDYKVTDALDEVARDRQTIEAIDVANTLYRIGGNSAVTAFIETLDDSGHQMYEMTKADMMRFLRDSGVFGKSLSENVSEMAGNMFGARSGQEGAEGISDEARRVFNIKPGQENAFRANLHALVDMAENTMLSTSNVFKETESRQFVRMSMAEMGRARLRGRESFTSSEVEEWAERGGGAQMVRSLLMTDAGHEAFMTQGITGLGRKSPLSHAVRRIMTANGVTELAVRTMFDRFPEYGMAKIERQIPLSNTMSYLTTYAISNNGDMLSKVADESGRPIVRSVGEGMSRVRGYQMGGTMDFWEGLRKNLLYDTVMAGNKLMMAALYKSLITMLGGIRPPEEEDDKYNWSEWIIGNDNNAMPLKWAWWMDDLSGVSLPLGTAWAIAESGGFSPESVADAANVFINAMANLNSGTALFDAIDLLNNFDMNVDDAKGRMVDLFRPGWNESLLTSIEVGFWELFGDLTPTVVEQLLPWSKDSLFRTDSDAHTSSYVYNTDEYTLEEAISGNHTKYVEDENERRLRNAFKYNPLGALIMDKMTGADKDGRSYRYMNMPLSTMTDDLYKATWDRFNLDLSTSNPDVPTDLDKKKEFVYEWAESALNEIMTEYGNNPTKASASGLVLNMDARAALRAYCNHMIYDELPVRKNDEISNAYLKYGRGNIPDDEWDRINDFYDAQYDYYKDVRDEWFGKDSPIPWSIPRYIQQESDFETRYVDKDQNASNYLNYALGPQQKAGLRNVVSSVSDMLGIGEYGDAFASTITDEEAIPQRYAYGNDPNFLPVAVPRTEGKGYNYETIPVWAITDDDGNLVVDMQDIYDMTGDMVAKSGRNEGKNLRELFFAGQGMNAGTMVDDDGNVVVTPIDEELNLGPKDVPTVGSSTDGRIWYAMDEKIPDTLQKVMSGDEDTINKVLGFDMSTKDDNENTRAAANAAKSSYGTTFYGGNNYGYGGGGRYYGGSYYGGGGGGGYYYSGGGESTYNPRIYSSSKQVYSPHAQGMSVRQPYKATSTYLRPSFYTSGSRKPYSRKQ